MVPKRLLSIDPPVERIPTRMEPVMKRILRIGTGVKVDQINVFRTDNMLNFNP